MSEATEFAQKLYHPPLGSRPGDRPWRNYVVDVSKCSICGKKANHVAVDGFVVRCMGCNEQHKQQERGKTMDTNSKPMQEAPTKKQNLKQQLDGLRTENEGLRRENERLAAQVKTTEKEYQTLVDTWSAYQAGLNDGTLPHRLEPKEMHRLQAQGEVARKLASRLLRWMNEPEAAGEED